MRKRIGSVLSFLIRAALTLVAIYGFVLMLQLVWLRTVASKGKPTARAPLQREADTTGKQVNARRLWPVFPGKSGPKDLREMVFNDVSVISESWEVTASSAEILDYYRTQMTARGWDDVTEEEYNLEPETVTLVRGEKALQNPKYVETYINVVEANLVLSKGSWSMHVAVEPGKSKWNRLVKISAASSPSILELGTELAAAASGGDTQHKLEVSEETAAGRYDTTISTSSSGPQHAFISKWEELRADNWSSLFRSGPTGEKGDPSYFAVLRKGDLYGYLTVAPRPDGDGASVVFTKVTEEQM